MQRLLPLLTTRSRPPGRNPFDGYTPKVPHGEKLDFGSDEFLGLEEQGLREVAGAAFVLVAGGLGERLGYSGALNRGALNRGGCGGKWRAGHGRSTS